MRSRIARLISVAALMLPLAASAEPAKLKLSFFTSDRSSIYQNSIKPFVDAVNNDGSGIVEIEVYFSGSITKVQADQPQLVTDGVADLALIVPGRSPERFTDTTVIELPGIYRDQLHASLVFTRLIEIGALHGYADYFVVGAFVADSESIHSRGPIATNSDLKGLAVRTNNKTQATILERLGATPTPIAINQTTEAISSKRIDAATFPPSMLFEFGVGRVASNHYMIQLGGAPTALVMNRKKFDSLPPDAQAILRKYSGEWLARQSAARFSALDKRILEQLKSDQNRKVTMPSPADLERVQFIIAAVTEEWATLSPHNRNLLNLARAESAKTRSSESTGSSQ